MIKQLINCKTVCNMFFMKFVISYVITPDSPVAREWMRIQPEYFGQDFMFSAISYCVFEV